MRWNKGPKQASIQDFKILIKTFGYTLWDSMCEKEKKKNRWVLIFTYAKVNKLC